MPEPIYRFAGALRSLLDSTSVVHFESRWHQSDVESLGWRAVGQARRVDVPAWEAALEETDGLLLALLERVPELATRFEPDAIHVKTFRLPALERLQHATAAALVAQRFGRAGLRTVVADTTAPVPRRYFAFLAIAERHPGGEWPLFSRYLNPVAHHAFVGTAAEAARFYPEADASTRLIGLFNAVRGDVLLRAFLSPRILESLYVLEDAKTLPFFRELLTAGYADSDPEYCEITRALVMVHRFTGAIEPNSKFFGESQAVVRSRLRAAEEIFDARRDVLIPVSVI